MSHERLGNLLTVAADPEGAKQAYREAAALEGQIHAAGIGSAQWPTEASMRAYRSKR